MRYKYKFLMSCIPMFYSYYGWASFDIYPIELTLKNQASVIQLLSHSDHQEFVQATVKQIINPGTSQEKEIDFDPNTTSSIIVSPQKMVLNPGVMKKVRLFSVQQPDKETVWRIYFKGVSAKVFNNNAAAESKQNEANVSINITWGALIHVEPKIVQTAIVYDPVTNVIRNSGTVRVKVRSFGVCSSENRCQWHPLQGSLYPEMTKKIGVDKKDPSLNNKNPNVFYQIKYQDITDNSEKKIKLNQ